MYYWLFTSRESTT